MVTVPRENLIDPGSVRVNTLDPVCSSQVSATADWEACSEKQQWK